MNIPLVLCVQVLVVVACIFLMRAVLIMNGSLVGDISNTVISECAV